MRKTKEQTLKDNILAAVIAGDHQVAEDLAKDLAALQADAKAAKKVKKAPAKPKIASKTKKATKAPSKTKKPISKATEPVEETESYIAPSRPNGNKGRDGQKFIDEEGRSHTYSTRVSMEGTKFKNKFTPNDYEVRLPANQAKADAKLRKAKISPRPGQAGASRPAATKVTVKCQGGCDGTFKVYPWECEKVDKGSRYICNDCIH